MSAKERETHISTTVEVKEMLKEIAKAEDRTLKASLKRIVEKRYEELKK